MSTLDQWRAIAGHIRALQSISSAAKEPSYNPRKELGLQCRRILATIEAFRSTYANSLSPTSAECIDRFIAARKGLIQDDTPGPLEDGRAIASIAFLSMLEAEMAFLLADAQEGIHSRSERAFQHLQRQIVADPDARSRWATALEEGETACEKLGAAHLLLHGIWGFKVHGEGERTDLVFSEPVRDVSAVERYADGIVLTEWKVCRAADKPHDKFAEALSQARLYGTGVMGGIELSGYRYTVVVSDSYIEVPPDKTIDGVVYRHINIAVNSAPPSVRARTRAKKLQ